MKYSRLEQNILDMVKEEQIKLGFCREKIRLYYPLSSLNRFLNTDLNAEEMKQYLTGFCLSVYQYLGNVEIRVKKDRFCFCLPEETAVYVHEHTPGSGFLYDLIETVSHHGVTMDRVLKVFFRYADRVRVERIENGEFDYMVWFEEEKPDAYRYCFTEEGDHITYHRFTEEDCRELME